VTLSKPADIPEAPGVYEYLDGDSRVLYVGKAKNLRARISDYFTGETHPRTARMLNLATTVRWTICASEQEALLLEREWIVKRQPPFNVRLRAGGGYGGVALTRGANPRLFPWRGQRPKEARTFGPYPGIRSHELVDALGSVFGVRTCTDDDYRRAEENKRPCLLGETGKCLAPCTNVERRKQHQDQAELLNKHMKNPEPTIGDRVREEMRAAAERHDFEEAARKRDRLRALDVIGRRQRVNDPRLGDLAAVVMRVRDERFVLAIVRAAAGVVDGVELLGGDLDSERSIDENLESALLQLGLEHVPLTETLVNGGRVARKDAELGLLNFAVAQAEAALKTTQIRGWTDPTRRLEALEAVKGRLGAGAARRIECLDISHGQGRHTVGSLITLIDGEPDRTQWRRLDLGELGGDDYTAIRDVVARRFATNKLGLTDTPDILLIDGGPGQVAAALEGMRRSDVTPVNLGGDGPYLLGIAKRYEELWPVGVSAPILLEASDPALLLLTLARDHAHANGVGAHRRRRDRAAAKTRLDDVRGIGETRRRALLAHFGTYEAVLAAPEAELATVRGIGPVTAASIYRALHPAD